MTDGTDTGGAEQLAKTCKYGHHWYTGQTCPLCDYLGRENLRKAHTGTGQ